MLASSIPYKFAVPWASAAAGNMVNDPIPATASGGNASQSLGYPPITAAPVGSGGIPPNVADENGAHFYETIWLQWYQAGAPVGYDATFSSNIGGYPNGAIIQAAAGTFHWQSTVDNNTTNPDSGGANWIRYEGGSFPRRQSIVTTNTTWTGASSGTMILVTAAATTQLINASTCVRGDTFGVSGPFASTLTLSSGTFQGSSVNGLTSITVPSSSWIAFQFDGTNWQVFSISPALGIGTVGGDLAGTLPNPTIKSSVALAGNPTTTTQLPADNSTKIATTGWVYAAMATIATAAGFAINTGANGYVKLPSWLGSLVINWGSGACPAGTPPQSVDVTFALAFPNACRVLSLGGNSNNPPGIGWTNKSVTGFTAWTNGGGGENIDYIAIGY